MNASKASPIVFVVPGRPEGGTRDARPEASGRIGQIKAQVRVGALRHGNDLERLEAVPGEDAVVLEIANGPSLTLHPETARDLMLAQVHASSERGAVADAAKRGEVTCPVALAWDGLSVPTGDQRGTRGFLGEVFLSAVKIITGLGKGRLGELGASGIAALVDGQVNAGVYALRQDTLGPLKNDGRRLDLVPASTKPMLVLVHGTFVDTASTFGKLWTQRSRVEELFQNYEGRVYALDHPTLGESPIANALTLARALPAGARLHLLTHSRGGLVAEVLARACGVATFGDGDLALFQDDRGSGEALVALINLVREKGITVDRMVRVACPARGTLLASKRLDAYISVFHWLLRLAGVPIAPELVELLGAVAAQKTNPSVLPGLAAMVPDSALVRWLNSGEDSVRGDLRVIAGDLRGDSVVSWLKTLLADAFYWTDNDLVVQTRSMYGGTPRAGRASFLLDAGGRVDHFSYFVNEKTVRAAIDGLTQESPDGYRAIGPLSWAGQDASGLRARAQSVEADPSKPAVFLLPGILGTHLRVGDKRIWLSLRILGGFGRLRYTEGVTDAVLEDGPMGATYDALIAFLRETHEVFPFGFDWRIPLEKEAHRLADAVDEALRARKKTGKSVRILAHSMGGLLGRTMLLERPDTFRRMMELDGARFVMLGTPNAGSWAPMEVLSGDDSFGNALVLVGAPMHQQEARGWMAEMPGFLQLQAGLLDPRRPLSSRETWVGLAREDLARLESHSIWHRNPSADIQRREGLQIDAYRWGVPTDDALLHATELRKRLDAQRGPGGALSGFAHKMALVVGRAERTPDGYEDRDHDFAYRYVIDGGDGRVTHASAQLPGVPTWQLDCAHGDLPKATSAFEAFLEVLEQGETGKLARFDALGGRGRAAASATPVYELGRPSRRDATVTPPDSIHQVLAAEAARPSDAKVGPSPALAVSVFNDGLRFTPLPLLVGHYRSSILTGTEKEVDRLIGGTLEESLAAGEYPDTPGSHQIFVNRRIAPETPWLAPRPEAVIVVGLGDEGQLRLADLSSTVRRGVVAWAQRVAERPGGSGSQFEIAATLLGSGGIGASAGSAARAILLGVLEANTLLVGAGWPSVRHLVLVELYADRALEAWRGLQVQEAATPDRFRLAAHIERGNSLQQNGTGALARPLELDYRGADYDLVTALASEDDGVITYTLDTKRARTEVHTQPTQPKLIAELLAAERRPGGGGAGRCLGRSLFSLLIPPEMDAAFGGSTEMVLELDKGTARLPWEVLDTRQERIDEQREPWAIRSKVIRKLQTPQTSARRSVDDATAEDYVLVVGNPACDREKFPSLPGAREEARAVAELLGKSGQAHIKLLLDDEAQAGSILCALSDRRCRIVHIAGHGELGAGRGVVMSGGTYLSSSEIRSTRTVPELVFVNCCHLGAIGSDDQPSLLNDPPGFAASVAEELIALGVRCVVAAGWAVDDDTARVFARAFYQALLDREPFIGAVARARRQAWNARRGDDNTWAAYQCYGDPHWQFRPRTGARAGAPEMSRDRFANVPSQAALALALETLAVELRLGDARPDDAREALVRLEARFASEWGDAGFLAQAFGAAYAELGGAEDMAKAVEWYQRALRANDGTSSIKTYEQLGNVRARLAWRRVEKARKGDDALRPVIDQARRDIAEALKLLDHAFAIAPTLERASLCGSAYKRLAMIEDVAASGCPGEEDSARQAEHEAIGRMADWYGTAERIAKETDNPGLFYPALARVSANLVIGAETAADLDAARASLERRRKDAPDFWSVAEETNLRLYEALAGGSLDAAIDGILRGFRELHSRIVTPWLWASVYDHAVFVLDRCIRRRADHPDQAAATKLIALLESFALG